ncbi:Nisin biosynthesis protein NisC [Bacillus cereus]|nr:Nisin biosynthesis protein NisC [Bacillus cereus]
MSVNHSFLEQSSIENIALDIGEKLKNPVDVKKVVLSKINVNAKNYIPWSDVSLSTGYPGLILMYSNLARIFPNQGWEEAIDQYLMALQETLRTKAVTDVSLFGGLTGIAYAVSFATKIENRYIDYLDALDQILKRKVQYFLDNGKKFIKDKRPQGTMTAWFDVMSGITGIGAYLLTKPNYFKSEIFDILSCLINLTNPIVVNGFRVPGWYIPVEYQFNDIYKKNYPKGNFNCGLAHGVSGILAFFSLCLKKGIEVEGQRDAMHYIAEWLISKRIKSNLGLAWPSIISFEQETEKLENKHAILRNAWCYGLPGIAYSFYLAGEALGCKRLLQESVVSYRSLVNQYKDNPLNTSGFCHGLAGNMHMLQRMMKKETEELAEFENVVNDFKSILISKYDEQLPFGFLDEAEGMLHKPGLLEGSAGICLSILSLVSDIELEWDRMFLLN